MSSPLSRRGFLQAGALGLTFSGLGGLASCGRPDHPTTRAVTGYGRLIGDPGGLLALPSGFTYTVLARSGGTPTSEGTHPSDPDGMALFDGQDGGSILVCNHENDGSEPHRVPAVEGLTYDPGAAGGTSTLVVDAEGRRVSQVHLAGRDREQLCRRRHAVGHLVEL